VRVILGAKWRIGLLSVAAFFCLPAAALAVFPGENGRIAFVSGRGGAPNNDASADVYILSGPNGIVDPLTPTAAGQHRHPAWSPDLKQMAYARWETANNEKIFIDDLTVPGPQADRVGPHASNVRDDRPSWSPDGTRIAYESEVTDGSGQMDILVANLETNVTINLTSSPGLIEGKPAWSPDGKTIYYSRRGLPPSTDDDILMEASDNSSAFPSFVVNSATAEYQPALSPDGKELCFTRGAFGTAAADVYKVASSGQGPQVDISDTNAGAYNCAWSPDGEQIAFVEGLFTSGALKVKNSDDTGIATLLTPDVAQHFDGNPDWAPKRPARCGGEPATIAGTDGRDELRGTRQRDVIVAHKGNDTVAGRRGNDVICGKAGDDKIRGARGRDTLLGGFGDDRLNGGRGRDECKGGRGNNEKANCER
jgi:Tol biopolymer transport system component